MRFFVLFLNVIFATKLADIQKYEETDPNLEQDEYKVKILLLIIVVINFLV